jgi:hypothetical protein
MNAYSDIIKSLVEANIDFSAGVCQWEEYDYTWNSMGFPKRILDNAKYRIDMLAGVLLFDATGKYIACGYGDEMPEWEEAGVSR